MPTPTFPQIKLEGAPEMKGLWPGEPTGAVCYRATTVVKGQKYGAHAVEAWEAIARLRHVVARFA